MAAPLVLASGLSGGAIAALIGIPVLGLGAYLLYRHNQGPNQAELREATEKFTRPGPRGERVFNEDAARAIHRALPGMAYSHPQPDMLDLVEIHPDRTGMPPATGLSAAQWLKEQNRRMSVLAPVYLPMPTGAERFLRLAQPGHEADLAPLGYAVLSYANALHRPAPGQPTVGLPPLQPQRSAPVPTPVSRAYAELPEELHKNLTRILKRPILPREGQALASNFARAGLHATADLVAAKTANAVAQQQLGMPAAPQVLPQGWAAPVAIVQALLNRIGVPGANGKPLAVDGQLGPQTVTAVLAFQKAHGLPTTSAVDGPTLTAMNAVVNPESSSIADTWTRAKNILHSTSGAVTPPEAQVLLRQLRLAPTPKGVQVFQYTSGLPVTGIVDLATQTALEAAVTHIASSGEPVAQHWMRLSLPGPVRQHALRLENYTGGPIPILATPPPVAQHALASLNYAPTFAGVQQFQTAMGLPATGFVDAATMVALQKAAPSVSSGAVSSLAPADNLATVQMWLVRLNLLPYMQVNGILDEPTRRAIRSFQSAKGLPSTGLLDERTASLLAQAATAAATNVGAPLAPYPDVPRQSIPVEPLIGSPSPWW
jgi:peptidoglycan hydrolase-like protein with peptidoglycan-binding domain